MHALLASLIAALLLTLKSPATKLSGRLRSNELQSTSVNVTSATIIFGVLSTAVINARSAKTGCLNKPTNVNLVNSWFADSAN